MLRDVLEMILERTERLLIGVVGDLFLDRYLDIDAGLTEPSLETGLDAYQVVRVRPVPGAAGTVINNLIALGVQQVVPISIIGDDGEGHELRTALNSLERVALECVVSCPGRRTPTYTKPLLHNAGQPPRELSRLDIKNRTPAPPEAQARVLATLNALWPRIHALVALDQVSEADCGVITTHVRERLAKMGQSDPGKLLLVDSRERLGLFRNVWLKPNRRECLRAVGETNDLPQAASQLARQTGRPVFCTCGQDGLLVVDPRGESPLLVQVPAVRVTGPIDAVGAGDSVSAALACAIAAGASVTDAAAFANLVASITIQQIGTTGAASPEDIRRRWQEMNP